MRRAGCTEGNGCGERVVASAFFLARQHWPEMHMVKIAHGRSQFLYNLAPPCYFALRRFISFIFHPLRSPTFACRPMPSSLSTCPHHASGRRSFSQSPPAIPCPGERKNALPSLPVAATRKGPANSRAFHFRLFTGQSSGLPLRTVQEHPETTLQQHVITVFNELIDFVAGYSYLCAVRDTHTSFRRKSAGAGDVIIAPVRATALALSPICLLITRLPLRRAVSGVSQAPGMPAATRKHTKRHRQPATPARNTSLSFASHHNFCRFSSTCLPGGVIAPRMHHRGPLHATF